MTSPGNLKNSPPGICCVGFVINTLLIVTMAIILFHRIPHVHRGQRFVLHERENPLPWISIFEGEGMNSSIQSARDCGACELFVRNLTCDSRYNRIVHTWTVCFRAFARTFSMSL